MKNWIMVRLENVKLADVVIGAIVLALLFGLWASVQFDWWL